MKPTVVKVGGVNGSGKTALARAIMSIGTWHEVLEPEGMHRERRPEAYECVSGPFLGWVVLGSYRNVCGGMDTITDKDVRLELVERYSNSARHSVVFFEGMMTGHTYGAIGALSESPKQIGRWMYVFMDTPFEECARRVVQRRKAAGNDAPFDPDKSMRTTHRGCLSVLRIAAERGHTTYEVDHKLKPEDAARLLLKVVKAFNRKR